MILHNARQVVTMAATAHRKCGADMREIGVREHASVEIAGDAIVGVFDAHEIDLAAHGEVIDCSGKVVLPGFVDSHTHAVFAGVRADEFAMRIAGKSYQEIATAGGGINHSVRSVRAATKQELVVGSRPRLANALRHGTTTIEVKSGYGLDLENELKLLEAARDLATMAAPHEVLPSIHTTFLGAHAVPPEYRGRQGEYVDVVINDMIPAVAARRLASYCDVFCDEGYFTVDESERMFTAAASCGMRAKVHADELADTDGAAMAARIGALSADHLLCVSDHGIDALREAGVVATLLPGTAYFLGLPYAPARRIIDAGCTVALASDFNPGSSPTFSMQMVISLACTQMKMTVEEALAAATINGAAALGLGDRVGSIEPGKRADIILCDVADYREIGYWFGANLVHSVIAGGMFVKA